MPLISKKQLIRYLINYTFIDDLKDEVLTEYFEKIFGISERTMDQIFQEKHKILLNNNDKIKDYIDFNQLKETIKKYVKENYN